ncbi:MAG: twin-arginine translocase TatA/TatE family subunit [bacterium]|nr:twin-arginine translocase TatA/TatE family subunit [bacterium]
MSYPLAILGLGPGELILLFVVILIVFGASRLPQIGSSLGKGLKNFRKGLKGEGEEKDQEEEEGK